MPGRFWWVGHSKIYIMIRTSEISHLTSTKSPFRRFNRVKTLKFHITSRKILRFLIFLLFFLMLMTWPVKVTLVKQELCLAALILEAKVIEHTIKIKVQQDSVLFGTAVCRPWILALHHHRARIRMTRNFCCGRRYMVKIWNFSETWRIEKTRVRSGCSWIEVLLGEPRWIICIFQILGLGIDWGGVPCPVLIIKVTLRHCFLRNNLLH